VSVRASVTLMLVLLVAPACDGGASPSAAQDRADATDVPDPRGGADRLGRRPGPWPQLAWIGSEPLDWETLRGRVVLVRFWTDTCPYCAASAPTLRSLHAEHADRGLTIIGVFHPKPRGRPLRAGEVREAIERFGWDFPVAVDRDWRTLDAWWLTGPRRRATSSSILLDREGVIRWAHPGPEYAPGSRDANELERAVEALLSRGS